MSDLIQVRARRANIAQLRAALDKEDAELATVERVLLRLSGEAPAATSQREPLGVRIVRGNKALVTRVLEDVPHPWMTADEIKNEIERTTGNVIGKTTLFPLLTAMKNEGLIVRDNRRVALPRRLEAKEM